MSQRNPLSIWQLTCLTSLGAGFEYYDFVVYAMLSPWLSRYFFPASHGPLHIVATLAIFATGYLIRPLGGTCFAYLGDRIGRQKVYSLVISIMGASTFIIACLPGYQAIGMWAPLLLLTLRLIQGASLGAELPGAIILLAEHAPPRRRGLVCGIQVACIGVGAASATFFCSFISHTLAASQMLQWGWRLPFILGSLLTVIGGIARYQVAESPLFIEQKKLESSNHRWRLLWQHKESIVAGISMLLLPASLVMFVLSLPALFHLLGYKLQSIYPAMTAGYLWCAICIPIFAAFTDVTGRKRWLKTSSLFGLILLSCLLPELKSAQHNTAFLWLFILGLQTWQAALSAAYFTRLAEIFPTSIRYLGYAFCYNLTYAVCGLIPMLVAWQSMQPHFIFTLWLGFILLIILCYRSVSPGQEFSQQKMCINNLKQV